MRAPAPRVEIIQTSPLRRRSSRGGGRRRGRRRHRSHGGGGGALTISRLAALGFGGFAVGFIEKQFPTMPTIPVLGKKGTIAAVGYYFSKGKGSNSWMRDITIAAAVLAGDELGRTGKISGDGDIADQISGGVAAQV